MWPSLPTALNMGFLDSRTVDLVPIEPIVAIGLPIVAMGLPWNELMIVGVEDAIGPNGKPCAAGLTWRPPMTVGVDDAEEAQAEAALGKPCAAGSRCSAPMTVFIEDEEALEPNAAVAAGEPTTEPGRSADLVESNIAAAIEASGPLAVPKFDPVVEPRAE
mmetsp:Transcript_152384/g.488802  ORF Transcript_152384/g.488802 Transcript_152384/m.488802 type:complete len:161 (+) Transcript_152384:195-677(+)